MNTPNNKLGRSSTVTNFLKKISGEHETYLAGIIIALSIYLGFASDDFFSLDNIFDMLSSYAMLAIFACGLLVVLISGGIDISFTATASIAQYLTALWLMSHGGNFILAFTIAALVGIVLGLVNAYLIHYLKVSAIIITVATLNVFYGLLIYFSEGTWLYDFPDWFMDGVEWLPFEVHGDYYSIGIPMITLVAVIFATWLLMSRSRLGRQIYALGGNQEAAERCGISVLKIHLFVYAWMGLMAGIGSIVQMQIVQSVAPNALVGTELAVVAAVVLGGASLSGGKGTLLGTMLGVILIAVMKNGLTLLGVSSYWHQFLTGVVILVSVSASAISARHQRLGC